MQPIIDIDNVSFSYVRSANLQNVALTNISLKLFYGEVFCILGESGSGKTTLAKLLAGLYKPSKGEIKYNTELAKPQNSNQILFQNSDELLNPRRKVVDVLQDVKVNEYFFKSTLNELNIPDNLLDKQCNVISGGERQRVALARILLTQPNILILDEPFSAQDFESRENFKTFLAYKNKHSKMTLIVITHDIQSIVDIADRVAVLFGGCIIEIAPTEKFLESPQHPYSKYLLSSTKLNTYIATNNSRSEKVKAICPYYSRCEKRADICISEVETKETKHGFVFCNKPNNEVK